MFGDALIECPTNLIAGAASARGLPVWKMVFNAGYQLHGATGAFLFSDLIARKSPYVLADPAVLCYIATAAFLLRRRLVVLLMLTGFV